MGLPFLALDIRYGNYLRILAPLLLTCHKFNILYLVLHLTYIMSGKIGTRKLGNMAPSMELLVIS